MALSKTGLIFVILHLFNTVTANDVLAQNNDQDTQDLSKRVPQGFLGMRGKKSIDSDIERFYKRKPQFFVGVKGKKNLNDASYFVDPDYKRAPMGFVGMRGKKEFYYPELAYPGYGFLPKKQGSLIGEIDYTAEDNLQNQQDFPLLNELLNEYLQKLDNSDQTNEIEKTNEIQKRAANQFYGVRGKKSIENKRPYDFNFRGRFIGVRGKKDLSDVTKNEEIRYLLDPKESLPKRKSQVGFFGMRGKKWSDDSSVEMEEQQ